MAAQRFSLKTFILFGIALFFLGMFLIMALQPPGTQSIQSEHQLSDSLYFHTLSEQTFKSDDFKNKVVYFHFFATWCQFCRKQVSEMKTFIGRHAQAKDLLIVGVAIDTFESVPKIKTYLKRQGIPFEVLPPHPETLRQLDFQGSGIPVTAVYDPQGKRRYYWIGVKSWQDLEKAYLALKTDKN